ncbi:MAG: hypothetical protein A3D28_05015 [Omnitrophica bacterium RIFCSPHIGHO2_02_FULL_63_14]|nr:MAG: hypothetical protein A3D28_05015 [Omnitrophica bacterium RIFCSPHIGHO2_02_FULL_63_14]
MGKGVKRAEAPAVAVLLMLLAAQALWAARDKAPTADELAHQVASGYSHLVRRDFRMIPASPPLPRLLSALPLLATGVKAPFDHPSWEAGNGPEFARQFFYHSGADADTLIFLARLPIIALSVLFAPAVYFWTRRLWGAAAGLAALALYAFNPDLIAHSALATADLAVALFFFLTLRSFWAYLRTPSPRGALVTGALTGAALLSKFSGLLLFPVLLVAWAFSGRVRQTRAGHFALFFLAAFLTIWAGYFFETKPLLERTPDPAKKAAVYEKIGGHSLLEFAQKVPVPLSTFASAVVSMAYTRAQGTNAFLLGEWSREGWWYYYFIAFGVKNTIPFLILSLLGWALLARRPERLTAAVLWAPVVLFFILTLKDKAQAGIRYFLPIYPLFCMAGGYAALRLAGRERALGLAAVALLVWHAGESLAVAPHHLAYFNEWAGGPKNGFRVLRDSNLDWGQDLKGLAETARKKNYPEIVLFYPWPASPDYYKIAYRPFRSEEFEYPDRAVYAVSAHCIDAVKWAKGRRPDAMVGYSIFVYDMRNA